MPVYQHTARFDVPVDRLWSWYDSSGAFRRIMPEWEGIEPVEAGKLVDGEQTRFKIRLGPLRPMWVARHHGVQSGEVFNDVMEKGPFGAWDHEHRFVPVTTTTCELVDTVNWRLPFHPLTFWTAPITVKGRLNQMFAYRTARVESDLNRIMKTAHLPRQRILISGSTGLIGMQLCAYLAAAGHHITRLVRPTTVLPSDAQGDDTVVWNDRTGEIISGDLNGFDTVIHLAGAGIGDRRWNAKRKDEIVSSRTVPTANLVAKLVSLDRPPKAFLCGSAIGFYGNRGDERLDEASAPGTNFLAETCVAWEAAAQPALDAGIRTVFMRTGIVTTPMGGALQKLLLPSKFGAGGPAGGGKQFYSWISLADQVYAIDHLMMTETCEGVYNLTAPEPVTQKVYAKTLGRVLRRPAFAPAPGFALRLLLGEMAQALVLDGQRVLPRRLLESGYEFEHADLETCLRQCLGRQRV
ncbi:MAG: TIGR01777 family protein [Candidatus Poseidonia sp.]|nr:TIGR01777 family protein [Poseidonia sp.]